MHQIVKVDNIIIGGIIIKIQQNIIKQIKWYRNKQNLK